MGTSLAQPLPLKSQESLISSDYYIFKFRLLRNEVVRTACSVDIPGCAEKANEHFSAWKANPAENK